jgi:hypothetical protein
MIRFIVDTVSSKRDSNGNRYHTATITSTATGRWLKVQDIGGPQNAVRMLRNAGVEWHEIHGSECDGIPMRQWRELSKGGAFEHHVNAEMLLGLELPQ